METRSIPLGSKSVSITFPQSLCALIDFLLWNAAAPNGIADHRVEITHTGDDRYALTTTSDPKTHILKEKDLPEFVMEAVIRGLITDMHDAVALHAGAVGHGDMSALIVGSTGAGKSTLTALLVDMGFAYLTDELVALSTTDTNASACFPRPLSLRADTLALFDDSHRFDHGSRLVYGDKAMLAPLGRPVQQMAEPGIIVFPQFEAGADISLASLSSAKTLRALLENNLNAKNLPDGGLASLSRLAKSVPAFRLRYGDAAQLEGVVDELIWQISETRTPRSRLHALLAAFGSMEPSQALTQPVSGPKRAIPERSAHKGNFKLTIGMATYDDYDGVYFTIQSLRLHHAHLMDDVEFIVIDNNPTGACAQALKDLENENPNFRYIPFAGQSGTLVRNLVFDEASGEFVMCLDCHVLLAPGALDALFAYLEQNPHTNDLIQGPLVFDRLNSFSTHFEPKWSGGMYGVWSQAVTEFDQDASPFEIGMQGLGLFVSRKANWPRFNSKFKGFGGEEGYIHQKFRARGDRTLCLPQLQWMHRFQRPMGIPYKPDWEDRVRNYTIGLRELGMDEQPMRDHFSALLGAQVTSAMLARIETELANPLNTFDELICINADADIARWRDVERMCEALGIDKSISRHAIAKATPSAVARAHLQLLRNAIRSGSKTILIVNDNAQLSNKMGEALCSMPEQNWDVIFCFNGTDSTVPAAIAYNSQAMFQAIELMEKAGVDKDISDGESAAIEIFLRDCALPITEIVA